MKIGELNIVVRDEVNVGVGGRRAQQPTQVRLLIRVERDTYESIACADHISISKRFVQQLVRKRAPRSPNYYEQRFA